MNASIAKLFGLSLLLFAILIGFTSRWTVFEADALRDNPKNKRAILEEQRIKRGTIYAADGTVLARSVKRGEVYVRRYPQGPLFGHPIGYYNVTYNKSELERSRNGDLAGTDDSIGSLIDQLSGTRPEGNDVHTTLDPKAQRVARQRLAGQKGAVVALDPQTGAVKAMYSSPGFDTRQVGRRAPSEVSGAFNRATGGGYPPGSTFKVVTAIAAIDSGEYSPSDTVSGENGKEISGVPLNNFGGQDFGDITLTEALTKSVNTVWAEVAEKLGKGTMQKYMARLGFGEDLALDLPDADKRASGDYVGRKPVPATDDAVDVGRMAIGQDKLLVTPTQMAMVAAAVANDGRLMRPHITDRIVDPDGRTVQDFEPEQMSRVMSADSARKVNEMMQNVVREGTGTAGALRGIDVAGKTGTAEVGRSCPNQAWFIGFAPAANPKVAVAVTLECTAGTGGVNAAPIARDVMQALLGN
ncbi:MAG TPA: penicillin-binding transpeptidase domain-containing protein [Baekduia sp.]|nr:penicillin-binding transpeptidase domain-containing protein [Baekduia sp.]